MECVGTIEDHRRIIQGALRSWGKRQRNLETERDPLVLAALEVKISKEEIHQSMGIARTTIDRIKKEGKEGGDGR